MNLIISCQTTFHLFLSQLNVLFFLLFELFFLKQDVTTQRNSFFVVAALLLISIWYNTYYTMIIIRIFKYSTGVIVCLFQFRIKYVIYSISVAG